MDGIPTALVFNFFLFLAVPFVCAVLAKKIKTSPVIGYMIGGVVLGSLFPNLVTQEAIKNFAYFGIVLLLFTVGLELNFSRIFTLKKFIIFGGSLQILLSIIFVFFLSLFFKFNYLESFLIGIALSSSSTTLVAKIIQDMGEESSFVGEIAMGILLFQDIAFIPFLIIFTSITQKNLNLGIVVFDILLSLLKSGLIISVLYYLGLKIVPRVLIRFPDRLWNFLIFLLFFLFFLSPFCRLY